jgi:hypothetical protein
MDFDFSDDQEQLRDAVRKWVSKAYDFERRRGIVKAGGFSREAWAWPCPRPTAAWASARWKPWW